MFGVRTLVLAGAVYAATMDLTACTSQASQDPRTVPQLAEIAVVQPAEVSERAFTGVVSARVQSNLGFRVSGKVIERVVDSGEAVHEGQPLMRLDRTDYVHAITTQVGNVDAAKAEMQRSLLALEPFFVRGVPLVGLEPSCLFSFRDEALAMLPGEASKRAAAHALLFEEFIAREAKAGRFKPKLKPATQKVLLHGHCHQKAFGAMGAVEQALKDPAWLGFATEGYAFSAVVFFVCCFAMSAYGRSMERRLARGQ